MENQDLLTVQQVAQFLGIHEMSVYHALNEGRLPYTELVGRKVIKRADAEAYKERTRAEGEKPKGRPKGSKNVKREGEVEAGEQS